jgi:tRNA pseudouridine-54 N-methylase
MKSILSRVHLHSHKEPQGRAYIVGDKKGLLELSKTIEKAARGFVGLESINLFSSDGHVYELVVISDVSEEEWQTMPVPYDKKSDPGQLKSIKQFESVKEEIDQKKSITIL